MLGGEMDGDEYDDVICHKMVDDDDDDDNVDENGHYDMDG